MNDARTAHAVIRETLVTETADRPDWLFTEVASAIIDALRNEGFIVVGNQPSLFDVAPPTPVDANDIGKWRADHPDTSRKAALDVAPRSGTQRRRVLDEIATAGPATDDEIQESLRMNGNTERPRRVELVEGGWLEDSGLRRPTSDGRQLAIVWRLARDVPWELPREVAT